MATLIQTKLDKKYTKPIQSKFSKISNKSKSNAMPILSCGGDVPKCKRCDDHCSKRDGKSTKEKYIEDKIEVPKGL